MLTPPPPPLWGERQNRLVTGDISPISEPEGCGGTSGYFLHNIVVVWGEIQLTDGLLLLLGSQRLYAYEFQGRRYDGGTPLGLLRAGLEFALARDDTREAAELLLKDLRN